MAIAWRSLGSLLDRASRVLRDLGSSIRSRWSAPASLAPSPVRSPSLTPPNRRPPIAPPAAPEPDEFGDMPPPEPPQREPPAGGEEPPRDQQRLREADEAETLTPQSGNVFAFRYERATSTLFVSYKAPRFETGEGSNRFHKGRLTHYQANGGRHDGKLNERGPTYAYFDVPIRVFVRMKLAASKGRFVWDELRVRGTLWGHQYRYSLVGAEATVTDTDGELVPYIPRRATRAGFRTRALADQGRGVRGFRTSTLPEQLFSTRTRGPQP
jgi:hypothetical protein